MSPQTGEETGESHPFVEDANQGLGPEQEVPAWAQGEGVHFVPAPSVLRQLTEELTAQAPDEASAQPGSSGARTSLGQLWGTDSPLLYRGGPVQHNPHVYLTFWGKNWNNYSGARTAIREMFAQLSGTDYQGILTQYFDHTGVISGGIGVNSWTDQSIAAPVNVNDANVRSEVEYAISRQSWPGAGIDNQYIILPAPGSKYESGYGKTFCAYHGYQPTVNAPYAAIPWAGDEPFWFANGCTSYDRQDRAWAATSYLASHEYAETVTNPGGPGGWGWYTYGGWEISDICATTADQLPNGSWVTGNWDNYQNRCSLADRTPPQYFAWVYPAGGIHGHYAEANGAVDPGGHSTNYLIEYGTTTAYGSTTTTVGIGSGATPVEVSQTLTNLSPNTTYHYRVLAFDSRGYEVWSGDRSFTTSDGRPSVLTNGASAIKGTTATVNALVNPEESPTDYHFEYGTTTSYGTSVPVPSESASQGKTAVAVSQGLTGLEYGTAYHYRIAATNDYGTSYGADRTFETYKLPTVKTGYPLEAFGDKCQLSGGVAGNAPLAHFYFEWGATTSYGHKTTGEWAGSSSTMYYHTEYAEPMNGSETIHYRIVAENIAGVQYGEDHTCWTQDAPLITNFYANEIDTNSATIRAKFYTEGLDTDWHFEYGTTTEYGNQVPEKGFITGKQPSSEMQYTIGELKPHTTYHYRAVASSTAGYTYTEDQVFRTQAMPPVSVDVVGGPGSGEGEFAEPAGLALDSEGNAYVADRGNNRIEKFDSGGEYLGEFASGLSEPTGLAIDGEDNVYVTEQGSAEEVHVFDAEGETLRQFGGYGYGPNAFIRPSGVAVDGEGNVYVADFYDENVEKYDSEGEYLATIGSYGSGEGEMAEPIGVAVDGVGNVYVADAYNHRIEKFDSEGEYAGEFESFSDDWEFRPTGIVRDSDGNFLVGDESMGRIVKFDADGKYVGEFGNNLGEGPGHLSQPWGLALSSAGEIWVSDMGYSKVERWALSAPSATTVGANLIYGYGAHLEGEVNPNGFDTDFYFEYGTTTAYGSRSAWTEKGTGPDPQSAGSGTSAVEVNAYLEDLDPQTVYHYRVVAKSEYGTRRGVDKTFETSAAPKTTTEGTTGIGVDYATMHGAINPHGIATSYHFIYGTEKLDHTLPVPDASVGSGTSPVEVSQKATGLKENQLYYYRLVSETASTGVRYGSAQTFTTAKEEEPKALTEAASAVHAEEATLNGVVNPHGDATEWHFEYGESTEYGAETSPFEEIGAGAGDVSLDETVEGLQEGMTYHYRVAATNSLGTTYGADKTFTTEAGEFSVWRMGGMRVGKGKGHSEELTLEGELTPTALGGSVQLGPCEVRAGIEVWNDEGAAGEIKALETLTPPCEGEFFSSPCEITEAEANELPWQLAADEEGAVDVSEASFTQHYGECALEAASFAGPLHGTWNNETHCLEFEEAGEMKAGSTPVALNGELCDRSEGLTLTSNDPAWSLHRAEDTPVAEGAPTWDYLEDVSCGSTKYCMGVGMTEGEVKGQWMFHPIAEHWDGVEWTMASPPDRFGEGKEDFMRSVSCTSSEACMAVGLVWSGATTKPLSEYWDGEEWSILSMPAVEGTLSDVSCQSADDCIAVGYKYAGGKIHTLVLHWDGEEWTTMTSPDPASYGYLAQLNGVSCPSASSCVAVGFYSTSGGGSWHSFVETYDGKEWSVGPDTGDATELQRVSCTEAGEAPECIAISYNAIKRFDGEKWSSQSMPGGFSGNLNDVSCAAPGNCVIAGGGVSPEAIEWDGGEWSALSPIDPASVEESGASGGYLYGVSCAARHRCAAVGTKYMESEEGLVLAEIYE